MLEDYKVNKTMFAVLTIMTIGIIFGFTIKNRTEMVKVIDPMIKIAIYLLLFLLGISVGTNETVIKNIDTLGAQALSLTFGGVTGSVVLSFFTYNFFFKTKK
jgi:uncharacterized membrane protein YbjE (DUF340 family)